jgi:hypothetical protein
MPSTPFLDERLAKHYGIEGVSGGTFRRVELTTDQRGGLLSQASILSISSYPTRTSPVIRGKYLLQNFWGHHPRRHPRTFQLLMKRLWATPGRCDSNWRSTAAMPRVLPAITGWTCLALGWRTTMPSESGGPWMGKFPVDISGTFPNGKSFSTPAEMKVLLKEELPDFARCIIEKMLTYSLGRGLEKYDRKTIDEIGRKLSASGYQFPNSDQ